MGRNNGGHGTLNVAGGTVIFSASLSVYGNYPEAGYAEINITSGSLVVGEVSGPAGGIAVINISGGAMTTSALYFGSFGDGQGTVSMTGGSLYSTSSIQLGTGSTGINFITTNKASVQSGWNFWVGSSAKVTFNLEGDQNDFTGPLVKAGSYYSSDAGAQGEINLSNYNATETVTITLIEAGGFSRESISWVITGLDQSRYSVGEGAYWDGSNLLLTVSTVPEPASAAALAGLLALALAVRRTKA